MKLNEKYIDELIQDRKEARENKNWSLSDEIRDYLDTKLVFVFDTKEGQEVHHLTEGCFKQQTNRIETAAMTRRQYVEYKIKQDINSEKNFDAWLYSMKKSSGFLRKTK